MSKQNIAIGLSAVGILFFLTVPFEILPDNIGTFGGVVCFFLAGLAWGFWPENKEPEK